MINNKKLSAALKNKTVIRWIKKDLHDYIICNHWVLKTVPLQGSSLNTLLKIFKTTPRQGTGIECKHGIVQDLTEDKIKSTIELIEVIKDKKPLSYTNLIVQLDSSLLAIFKDLKNYIYVDKTYVDLVNLDEDVEIYGSGSNKLVTPVYFSKGNEIIMILPVKVLNDPIYLKEIG